MRTSRRRVRDRRRNRINRSRSRSRSRGRGRGRGRGGANRRGRSGASSKGRVLFIHKSLRDSRDYGAQCVVRAHPLIRLSRLEMKHGPPLAHAPRDDITKANVARCTCGNQHAESVGLRGHPVVAVEGNFQFVECALGTKSLDSSAGL